jgi:HSP20 family protein
MEVIMTNAMQKTKTNSGYGLENVVDNIFNHTMRRFFDGNLWDLETTANTGTVPVNVRETDSQYELDVIAPGCQKADFNIKIENGELMISFKHNEEKNQENEKAGWVRNEYIQRSFSRSFTLDDTVEVSNITANYNDGILRVVLPKNEKAKPVSLSIDVK